MLSPRSERKQWCHKQNDQHELIILAPFENLNGSHIVKTWTWSTQQWYIGCQCKLWCINPAVGYRRSLSVQSVLCRPCLQHLSIAGNGGLGLISWKAQWHGLRTGIQYADFLFMNQLCVRREWMTCSFLMIDWGHQSCPYGDLVHTDKLLGMLQEKTKVIQIYLNFIVGSRIWRNIENETESFFTKTK